MLELSTDNRQNRNNTVAKCPVITNIYVLDWFHNEHTIVCIPKWIPKQIWGIIIQMKDEPRMRRDFPVKLTQTKGTNSNILVRKGESDL